MKSGGMPTVQASEEDVTSLIAYLSGGVGSDSSAAGRPASPEDKPKEPATVQRPPARPQPPLPSPVTKRASIALDSAAPRGKAFCDTNGCAGCHGQSGAGTHKTPALRVSVKTEYTSEM